MRTLITAKDEKELKMRVDDLILRGFKVIQTFEPEQKQGGSYTRSYTGGKTNDSKKKYVGFAGYVKHRTLMERA